MNGDYLICPSDDEDDPFIYLLLEIEGDQCGICVNREHHVINGLARVKPMKQILEFSGWYERFQLVTRPTGRRHLPILQGGSSVDEVIVLHNALPGTFLNKAMKDMYRVSPLDDFLRGAPVKPFDAFVQFVKGYRRFKEGEIVAGIFSSGWELRRGLHAFAFGPCLEEKSPHISTLKKHEPTNEKVEKFDLGALISSTMGMFHEAAPSIMHHAVAAYLGSKNSNLDFEKVLQTTRLMIAVSETQSNDITDIMRKYTGAEVIAMYDSAVADGFEFRLLKKFDKRIQMLRQLGFNPLAYDVITSRVFAQGRTASDSSDGRADDLESAIDKMEEIIKSEGGVGEAE
jgi:hypothetical protein